MPTLRQRISFLRRRSRGYLKLLLLQKLGKKRLKVTCEGKPLVIPLKPAGGVQLAQMVEPWMPGLLRKLLPAAPGTFVDVGANVGAMLVWLRMVDAERPWIGFEPSPQACAYIRELIAANGFRNATLVEAGLSDEAGSATLYRAGGTDSSASMIRDFHGEAARQDRPVEVSLRRGADLADAELAERVGVVKIDVEGLELEVVRGLKPILERDRPLMIFEVLPVTDDGTERAKRLLKRQAELTDEVKSLGYRLAQIGADGSVTDVDAPRNDTPILWANYLGIPEAAHPKVRPLLAPQS